MFTSVSLRETWNVWEVMPSCKYIGTPTQTQICWKDKEAIPDSFDDAAETIIDKPVENNMLHTARDTATHTFCLKVCGVIMAMGICFQWQSWWSNYHLISSSHTSYTLSPSCFFFLPPFLSPFLSFLLLILTKQEQDLPCVPLTIC